MFLTYGRTVDAPRIPFDAGRWHARAACAGMDSDLFFPEVGQPTTAAKAVCDRCPVRPQCDEWGLWERFGVWAGQSERDRKRRRQQLDRRRFNAAS